MVQPNGKNDSFDVARSDIQSVERWRPLGQDLPMIELRLPHAVYHLVWLENPLEVASGAARRASPPAARDPGGLIQTISHPLAAQRYLIDSYRQRSPADVPVQPASSNSAPTQSNQPASSTTPDKSPGTIAYVSGGNIWIVDPGTGERRAITNDGGYHSPSITRDGTVGVIQANQGTVWLVRLNAAGNVISRIPTAVRGNGSVVRARLSPDGGVFAVLVNTLCWHMNSSSGPMAESQKCNRLATTPSTRWELLEANNVDSNDNYTDLGWINEGRLFASITNWCVQNFSASMNRLVRNDTMRFCMTTDVGQPNYRFAGAAVSSDGGITAVVASRQQSILANQNYGAWQLSVFRTLNPLRPTYVGNVPSEGYPASPGFSPDGRKIAFSDSGGLKVYDLATGRTTVIDPNGQDSNWGSWHRAQSDQ